jgi:hypothetical protein
MPKRSPSQQVPKEMQARFEEITQLTDGISHAYLNEEYRQINRELTATLCRKRPSPLVRGKATTWACGIIHALGMVNFLFDSSQTPHIAASQIWEHFQLSSSTMQARVLRRSAISWACIPWTPIGRSPPWLTRIP